MTRYIRKTRGPTAICQVCGVRRALNLNGGIRMHEDLDKLVNKTWTQATCPGSHQRPVAGTIKAP